MLSLNEVLDMVSTKIYPAIFQLKSYSDGESQQINESFTIVEISYQKITFEHLPDCHMLTIRDISHLERLEK